MPDPKAKQTEQKVVSRRHPNRPAEPVAPLALRPKRAAQALDISESLLWEWIAAGDIPVSRIGRVTLIQVDALREFMDRTTDRRTADQQSTPAEG